MTLWAIERRDDRGKWRIDHTTLRFARREAWRLWEQWWQDPKTVRRREQRAGKLRAVKVEIRRVEE